MGRTVRLTSFVRRTWLAWLVCAALGAAAWAAGAVHTAALGHPAFVSGWLLSAAMLWLTLYNLRKKLDFLPALLASRHWLWGHLVVGYLSVWLFALHTGWRLPSGPLETTLWLQFVGVIASGVLGHYVSRRFPALLADRGQEVLYERIPVLLREQRERAQAAVLEAAREGDSTAIPDFYAARLLGFLAGPRHAWAHLLGSRRPVEHLLRGLDALARVSGAREQALIVELEDVVRRKDDLDFHAAHQAALKYWLFLHVPLAYSLLVVAGLHVVVAYAFGGLR
ncbi:MAG: hypothetical protein AB7N76_29380 [Planctomycetota bacterium]